MDYRAYREAFFTDPAPGQRRDFEGAFGFTMFFDDYEEAVAFYSQVLSSPTYVEGENTRGWKLGDIWLTLLRAVEGNPRNAEIQLAMSSEEDSGRLQKAFLGGQVEDPAEVLMFEPVKIYPLVDPFGTNLLFVVRILTTTCRIIGILASHFRLETNSIWRQDLI